MSAHSTLGPSSAERWANCAGSVALSANCPKPPTSVFAAEGTVAHTLAEDIVTGKADVISLMERVGSIVKQEGFDIEITSDMVDGAILYNDTIRAELFALNSNAKPSPVVTLVEKRIQALSVDSDVWGTLDFGAYRKGDTLIIVDYKYGKGKAVEATENDQLSLYAVALMDTQAGWAYDKVKLIVVQPRAPHAEGPVREWETTTASLKGYAAEMRDRAQKTREPNAPLNAGAWCRWCPAKAACPEIFKEVQSQAQVDFKVIPSEAQMGDATSKLPAARLLSSKQLAQALAWEDPINSWFEAVRASALEILQSGGTVPGFKLVDKRVTRQWKDEQAVLDTFGPVLGENRLYEKKLLSPAKLEKVVGKKVPLVDAQGEDLTFKPVPEKTIAPSGDARGEALPTAAADFEVLPHTPKPSADDLMAELLGGKPEPKSIWP